MGDIWTLAALQRKHVFLPSGRWHICSQANELPWALVNGWLSDLRHLRNTLNISSSSVYSVLCIRLIWLPALRLSLQSDVQPPASIVEGASSEAGRLRGPPQKRAVRNTDWADQSPTLPAGWRSYFLHNGPGDYIPMGRYKGMLFIWQCFRSLNMWNRFIMTIPAYFESFPKFWVMFFFSFFLLNHRLNQRWRAAWISSAVCTTCLASPSSFTFPPVQRSIWVTSLCGTKLRR